MSSLSGKKRPREEQDAMEFIAKNFKTVEKMLDQVDATESCSDPSKMQTLVTEASTSLLQLKSIQRSVLENLKDASGALREKRAELEKQSMTLQSLEYEKAILEQQIGAEVSTPHLERMCREETQISSDDAAPKNDIMNTFLCGSPDESYEDPARYQQVLAKLHKEINLRGSLERDAIQIKKTLTEKQRSLKESESFLKELPKKLAQVEKASLPLQKFFGTDSTRIGTERSKRFELARSLPGPLYTLFVQLQSYLDASPEPGVSINVKTSKSTTDDAWFERDEHAVQLHLLVPETKNKQVTIDFYFLPKLDVVTAQAVGSADKVDLNSLLANIFPGDAGNMTWSAGNVHLKDQAASSMTGRPYHWCNYLAGIHQPSNTSRLDPISTKAIFQELNVRLNANSTLTNILTTLKKKPTPIPTHSSWMDPSGADGGSPFTRLVGWTQEQHSSSSGDDSDYTKTFVAILKNKNSKLKATVTVDMSRYPSVPPKWTLTSENAESWGQEHGSMEALEEGTNPLYDNALGQMERSINSQLEKLVNASEKESYNWILAHQLHRLANMCDDYFQSSGAGQVPRSIKGKDRVALSES